MSSPQLDKLDSPAKPATAVSGRTPAVIRLLVLATFVVILNETIMINAIPRLMSALHITEQTAQWLSTAFMLTMAAVIPITGWFLQRVSTRSAYTTAMGLFLLGTALAAVAPSFEVLLGARIIQASGTAVMMPLLMTTLMQVVPEEDRGRVMGNVSLAISVAPAMGPTVSGVILQFGSWRLLFAVVLPIAAVITWRGLKQLKNVGEPQISTIDWLSAVTAAAGFGGLVYGLSRFEGGDVRVAAAIVAAGLVAIAVFVVRQLSLQKRGVPLLDLRTLRHRTYTVALILMSVAFMAMLGSMILLPLYLQNVRELSALQTGLLVMPGSLAMGLLGPTVGRLFDRFGGRVLVIPGAIGITLALTGFTQVTMTMPFWQLLGLHALLMVSLAATFTPVFTLGLGAVPPPLYSHASSILSTLQQVSAAVGTALVITVMSARADALRAAGATEALANLDGMRLAFIIGAVLSVAVVITALLLPARADSADEIEGTAPASSRGTRPMKPA
ncbi:multidrug efflux MFS transporter [Streptosporangium sp. NBC_01755]|uniref:MDR family MFS transporter n=1 Tax=unclassified Streptosporangium TaxID=2632669 RepID=UPI002DD84352|nr:MULTISPECIES: MDR family MFS transporter [unclassified Streptosporangium]WSA25074.1 multidrug efflux MFS transporter [Streptosporangium sp. NBC_01810]WSD03584.1 multidrug efflux MFS transporter [Streptosporangium sp. NBC_01755]